MYFIGIDAGSTTTKGVIFDQAGDLLDKRLLATAGSPQIKMKTILDDFTSQYAMISPKDFLVVTTGYGRELIDADLVITEITCHGRGAEYLSPNIKYVIDIGGQDCKVIHLNGQGMVMDFSMNDRCAAGTGRFVEVMMRTLGEDIQIIDQFVKEALPVKINSMCTVFAESEVVSLVAKGEQRQEIAAGVLYSIAKRIGGQFAKLRPIHGDTVLLTGGLSRSQEFANILSEHIKSPIVTHELSQFAGCIGAALAGMRKYYKIKGK